MSGAGDEDDEIWFWSDATNEDEVRFLTVLRARAESWDALDVEREDTQAWPNNDPFCVHVDLGDASYGVAYGSLRVDYDGVRLVGGWSDGQLVHPIDLTAPDSFETSAFTSPEAAAAIAGHWLEAQLSRPIERREWWDGRQRTYVVWVLADVDYPLCATGPGRPPGAPRGPWCENRPPPVGELKIVQVRPARSPPNG
jgi:hypothetical protein